MKHRDLDTFLSSRRRMPDAGPVAVILAEDTVELGSTLRHHLRLGFAVVLVLMPDAMPLDDGLASQVHRIGLEYDAPGAGIAALNRILGRLRGGTWVYWGFNAEYLFYPFSDTRRVDEMLAFHSEERRDAMYCYTVDLFAPDLRAHPTGIDRASARFDRSGYFAQARPDPVTGHPLERQLDIFGGLRWRFEQHLPPDRRRIDRIALLRAGPGVTVLPDHRISRPEYNTYACAWHNNLTAAVASFRVAKALMANPGPGPRIESLDAGGSVRFDWSARQLLELGMIEPGQWF